MRIERLEVELLNMSKPCKGAARRFKDYFKVEVLLDEVEEETVSFVLDSVLVDRWLGRAGFLFCLVVVLS